MNTFLKYKMASNYSLFALIIVALIATSIAADKGKGPKGKMMGVLSCLTEESFKTLMETKNATIAACMAELSPVTNGTTQTVEGPTNPRPTRDPKHQKPDVCFMECMWKKSGLVKDASFVLEDYAKANVKPEHQEKLQSKFTKCLTKEGLSITYTVNKEHQCKSLEKYVKCLEKASKVCKADSSSFEED